MQFLLDQLLRTNSTENTLVFIVRVLDDCIPEDFQIELTKGTLFTPFY
jgi:hypothetical protein